MQLSFCETIATVFHKVSEVMRIILLLRPPNSKKITSTGLEIPNAHQCTDTRDGNYTCTGSMNGEYLQFYTHCTLRDTRSMSGRFIIHNTQGANKSDGTTKHAQGPLDRARVFCFLSCATPAEYILTSLCCSLHRYNVPGWHLGLDCDVRMWWH